LHYPFKKHLRAARRTKISSADDKQAIYRPTDLMPPPLIFTVHFAALPIESLSNQIYLKNRLLIITRA